jgi:hypothetical protein
VAALLSKFPHLRLKRLPQASTSLLHPTTSAQNSTTDSTPIQTKLPLHPASTVKREPVARMSGRPSVFTSQVCSEAIAFLDFLELLWSRRCYLSGLATLPPQRHTATMSSYFAPPSIISFCACRTRSWVLLLTFPRIISQVRVPMFLSFAHRQLTPHCRSHLESFSKLKSFRYSNPIPLIR